MEEPTSAGLEAGLVVATGRKEQERDPLCKAASDSLQGEAQLE